MKSRDEWHKYCKGELPGHNPKPDDIPATPEGTYKDKGWTGWGDWLGTGTVATFNRRFRPFKKARLFVHKLKLRNLDDWCKYCKGELPGHRPKPDDIPAAPGHVYKDEGWAGVGDWLGTGTVAPFNREFWPFKKGPCIRSQTEVEKFRPMAQVLQRRTAPPQTQA